METSHQLAGEGRVGDVRDALVRPVRRWVIELGEKMPVSTRSPKLASVIPGACTPMRWHASGRDSEGR